MKPIGSVSFATTISRKSEQVLRKLSTPSGNPMKKGQYPEYKRSGR